MSLGTQDGLRRRPGSEVAAYRRPGVIGLLYLYRAIAAFLLALPLSMALSQVIGSAPRGDAELFDPGGLMLLEAYRMIAPSAVPLGFQAAVTAVFVGFFGLVPLAMLLDSLSVEGRLRWGTLVQRAFRRLGTLSLLFGIAVLAEAGAAAIFVTIGDKTLDRVAWSDSRHRDIAHVIVWGVGLLIFILIGILHDLSRVMVVRKNVGLYSGVSFALRIGRRRTVRILFSYGVRLCLGAAAIAGVVWVTPIIGYESTGDLALMTLVSQAAILATVYLRVDWLAAAMRIGDRVYDEEKAAWEQINAPVEPARESMFDLPPSEPSEAKPPPSGPRDSAEDTSPDSLDPKAT